MRRADALKKCAVYTMCLFVFANLLPAFGRGETEVKPVEETESWREVFELSEKKPGKYNIYAKATDSGQNVTIAGPYNIYIDPESDLPVIGITNPVENMRVASNLNVVGTCVDDDAVQYVDLIIDGNETDVRRAEGSAFWSYYLDTTGMEDGVHTITVFGTDINGVQGHSKTVTFHVDRDTPTTLLQSHSLGSLVSGKVKLAGIVSDGNGIKQLAYSLDGGQNFELIKISFDKKQNLYTFNCEIDTKAIKDGPSVCWFKATDLQGSIGIYTFLFFVDNTKPAVKIVYPAPSQDEAGNVIPAPAVNGVFHVTGYAGDTLGLSSLQWKFGKESGNFEIILGNPWWEKEFDVRNSKEKSIPLEIIATDITGNITSFKQNIAINTAADLPVTTVTEPVAGESYFDSPVLTGFVTDDDAPAKIKYSIDGGEFIVVDTQGAFSVLLPGLSAGTHTLTVSAVDAFDVEGIPVSIPFTYAGSVPEITVTDIYTPATGKTGDIVNPYVDGLELHPEVKNIIRATFSSGIGLKSWSYSFAGMDPVSAEVVGSSKSVEIAIPASIRYGSVPFTISAIDTYDRTTEFYGHVYITNLSKTRVDLPARVEEFTSSSVYTDLQPSLSVTVPAVGKKTAYQIDATISLTSFAVAGVQYSHGLELQLPSSSEKGLDGLTVAIETTSPINALLYSMDGEDPVKLSAKKMNKEGTSFSAVIPFPATMSADIHTFTVTADIKNAGTIGTAGIISVLRPIPAAGIADDETFLWISHKATDSKFLVEKTETVSGVYIPKTLCTLASAAFEKTSPAVSVNLRDNTVLITFSEDGSYDCGRLILKDSTGSEYASNPVSFVVDSDIPIITVQKPEEQQWVQNSVTVSGSSSDNSGIASLLYRIGEGDSWLPLTRKNATGSDIFEDTINLSAVPDGLVKLTIRATDTCGKSALFVRTINKDTVVPSPVVSVPTPEVPINGENRISFFIQDAGIIDSIAYGFVSESKDIEWRELPAGKYVTCIVGNAEHPLAENMRFRFIDKSGNETVLESWPFVIDPESDLPVVEIHLPAENEVMRRDFVVSGVVFDDDKPAKVWYKIDDGEYKEIPVETSFAIPIELLSLTDNEHSITMCAEDVFGLKGHEVVRNFRVSLEEPKAQVERPSFEETVKGIITISGTASDKNGIKQVYVSLDNGNSFNRAEGTETWSYTFDSQIIQDGTHVVFVKVWDNYDTLALYSSLINTDNTAPEISVTLPIDTDKVTGDLFLTGNISDNIHLNEVFVKIRSLADKPVTIPPELARIELERDLIINKVVNISSLPNGPYNIEFTGSDAAGNISCASRNIILDTTPAEDSVNVLYPLNGENVQGQFNLYGNYHSREKPEQIFLYIDDVNVMTQPPTDTGYFCFKLTPEILVPLGDGEHSFYVSALMPKTNEVIKSAIRKLSYSAAGPWITLDNFDMGDFAIERPWIEGRSGYSLSEEDLVALKSKETTKEKRLSIEEKKVESVEISFDNGKTFTTVDTAKKWRYRLQTQDMAQGYHFMVIRAIMENGEIAVTRSIARIDKTPPFIKLIAPTEGMIFNENLVFSGLSSDDVNLETLELALRAGDKSAYELPSFIQGLFLDAHFWGATLYDIGFGLTFFDDNVKLQFQYGQFTQQQRDLFESSKMRYGGNVLGLKLIANIAAIPFSYFLGPDWNWLSASLSIGANFSMFSESQKGDQQILSAILLQLEFPRITFAKQKMFRTFSFYTEGQVWFIPTDVQGTDEVEISTWQPQISCGVRLNVF